MDKQSLNFWVEGLPPSDVKRLRDLVAETGSSARVLPAKNQLNLGEFVALGATIAQTLVATISLIVALSSTKRDDELAAKIEQSLGEDNEFEIERVDNENWTIRVRKK